MYEDMFEEGKIYLKLFTEFNKKKFNDFEQEYLKEK